MVCFQFCQQPFNPGAQAGFVDLWSRVLRRRSSGDNVLLRSRPQPCGPAQKRLSQSRIAASELVERRLGAGSCRGILFPVTQ
jgi:hypothetical protein